MIIYYGVNVVVVTLIDNAIHYNRDSVVEISHPAVFYRPIMTNAFSFDNDGS